jgi:putative addiction module component (TIGR02574 family)
MPSIDFNHLSVEERLDLIGDLWDSLDAADVPVPADVRAELDRRNATFTEARSRAVPWAVVKTKLRPGRR